MKRQKFPYIFSFYLLALLLASGCASLDGHRQILYLQSSNEDAQVTYPESIKGPLPKLVQLNRQPNRIIYIQSQEREEKFRIVSKYRWLDSFAKNLVFLGFAPIGWIVDLVTGAAWEYNNPEPLAIASETQSDANHQKLMTNKQKLKLKSKKLVLLVAPPQVGSGSLSDELGHLVVDELQKQDKYKNYQIVPYRISLETFQDFDFDYNTGEPKREKEYEILYKENAQAIFTSKVKFEDEAAIVDGQIHVAGVRDFEPARFTFLKQDLTHAKTNIWADRESKIFYFVPNSIYLNLASKSTELTISGSDREAENNPTDDFLGKTTQYLSAVGLKRIEPPTNRPGWRGRVLFAPAFNISQSDLVFHNDPLLKDQEFEYFHLDAGYGPSFNWGSKQNNFYLNIIPMLTYDVLTGKSQLGTFKKTESGIQVIAEIGYTYFVIDRVQVSVFSKSISLPESLWGRVLTSTSSQLVNVESATIFQSGLSISYMIPNWLM